jgi:uncharacterized protein (DUF302 family)
MPDTGTPIYNPGKLPTTAPQSSMIKPFPSLIVTLSVLAGACNGHLRETSPDYYEAETSKPYADVLAELQLAITERNFRITGHNKIGSVIRERESIAFPDYDTLQFCNLTYAREMLALSPSAVRYMPCNIAVRSENDRVVVTTHLLPTNSRNPELDAFANRMNDQLKAIVDFAVED